MKILTRALKPVLLLSLTLSLDLNNAFSQDQSEDKSAALKSIMHIFSPEIEGDYPHFTHAKLRIGADLESAQRKSIPIAEAPALGTITNMTR